MKSQLGVDIIGFPLTILFIIFVLLAGVFVAVNAIPPLLQAGNVTNTAVGKQLLNLPHTLDMVGWIMVLSVAIGLLVIAWVIDANPIFYFGGVISLIVAVYLAVKLKGAFQLFGNTSFVNQTSPHLSVYGAMINNLPIIVVAVGVLALILTYIHYNNNSGGGNGEEYI